MWYHCHSWQFRDAYECEKRAVEQAERALILDELRPDDGIKCRMSSGTSRCALSSPEQQTTPITLASVLPAIPTVSASPTTPVPQEAPEEALEGAKPEEKGDDPAAEGSSKAEI